MPINKANLDEALQSFQIAVGYDTVASQGGWERASATIVDAARKRRAAAIRGERHIRPIYKYCTKELVDRKFREAHVFPSASLPRKTKVHGGFFEKEVDAGVSLQHTGPLLLVSVKGMLTAARNLKNRVEEAIADAANLHTRYPMLCFGFLMIVPYRLETEKKARGHKTWVQELIIGEDNKPTALGENFVRYTAQLQPRGDITETPGRYEAVALAVVNFDVNPPVLHRRFPEPDSGVRIERFFDVLHERFVERNRFISEVFE